MKQRFTILGLIGAILIGSVLNAFAFTNGQAADVVIGFRTFSQSVTNQADTLANTLNNPFRIHCFGSNLFVSDSANFRALIFNSPPSTWDVGPDVVLGLCDPNTGMLANRSSDITQGDTVTRADALNVNQGGLL